MPLINITIKGTTPDEFQKYVRLQFISVKNGMKVLGEETRDHMREIIKNTKHRGAGTGNLENSINSYVSETPTDLTVGVGDVSEMNYRAPYWYLVNYGGMSIPASRGITLYGYFGSGNMPDKRLAGSGVGREPFVSSQNNLSNVQFFMRPKNPVYAMNYIEKTKSWLITVVRIHFSNWTGKTKVV